MRRTRKRTPPGAVDPGPRLTAFPPLLGASPRLLILGSLPGAASLAAGEYYAHPRNLFWDVMGELFGAGRELPYAERTARLVGAGVAVWDVLRRAHRPGSLDSNIADEGLEPNDFAPFFRAHPTLRAVAFNGGTAQVLFRRHVVPDLRSVGIGLHDLPPLLVLPSTSPAHAGRTRDQKMQHWRAVAAHAAME